jgi:hypothetical protein
MRVGDAFDFVFSRFENVYDAGRDTIRELPVMFGDDEHRFSFVDLSQSDLCTKSGISTIFTIS